LLILKRIFLVSVPFLPCHFQTNGLDSRQTGGKNKQQTKQLDQENEIQKKEADPAVGWKCFFLV